MTTCRPPVRFGSFLQPSGAQAVGLRQFRTAHDGFTLNDIVSYNEKHNEANGEDNRDGTSDNHSWNCGVEGPTGRSGNQCASRAPDAQHAGDAAAVAGHADDAGGRRIRAHAARQQQRLLPGQRDQLGGLDAARQERCAGQIRAADSARCGTNIRFCAAICSSTASTSRSSAFGM